jgi:hypothetical protein
MLSPGRVTWGVLLVCLGAGLAGAVEADRVLQWRERVENAPGGPVSAPVFVGADMFLGPARPPAGGTSPGIREGGPAPDFTLPSLDGGREVRFERLHRGRPVVLAFGSLTCDIFCGQVPRLERLFQEYQGHAAFLFVNVREARHTVEGLEFFFPDGVGLPNSSPERRAMVCKAMAIEQFTWPAVIDGDDNQIARAYGGFPLRLVLVGTDGQVVNDLGQCIDRPWDLEAVEGLLGANTGAE